MGNAIEAEGLTRRFGRKLAVSGLSFRVPHGSLFALLGPNGAGKTTAIKLLMNLLEPTRGNVRVLGTDSTRLGPSELAQIGYVSENQRLPGWMTVAELLAYLRPLYPSWNEAFCRNLLGGFSLPLNEKIKNLSRGMKVKAALLSSLAYRPRLLVLDEPFSGLDPLVREELIRGVLEWAGEESWTVLISSQDVDEIERLADWVAFLDAGNLVLDEAPLPAALPAAWLQAAKAGRTVRFVDSRYSPASGEAIAAVFPNCAVTLFPMSLREVFLTLARNRRSTSPSLEV
ncbi:MAG: ABC transporter ATP-binding protein [Acidobacteria bacterium]|nr:MAG: ABC transporter ATP-binding protein [Acidobacteriota bacterium]